MTTGVAERHSDYNKHATQWQRARDVIAGRDAVHAASELYLPRLHNEDAIDYAARLKRTPFYNASFRTIAGFVGMIFAKDPVVEVPEALKPLLEDVTLSGISFDNFARTTTEEDLTTSRAGILVDHPPRNPAVITKAQQEAANERPTMRLYSAEDILNWEEDRVNNRTVVTQVRLRETHSVKTGEFSRETKFVIRVLDLEPFSGNYRIRIFDEQSEELIETPATPLLNGKPLKEIPFYPVGPSGTEVAAYEPIMIDLFDTNLDHYRVSADYEHACHMTALPTPWVANLGMPELNAKGEAKPREFYLGSTTLLAFSNDVKLGFLEYTGQGITELRENLKMKEGQMAAIGARMLAPEKSGVEAAETLHMRHSGENSILASVAIAVSEGLTKALRMFGRWTGLAETAVAKIVVKLNKDFLSFNIDPAKLTALLAAVQAGKLSWESFFNLMKRGDLIEPEVTFEDEQARVDDNPPPAPIPPGGGLDEEDPEDKLPVEKVVEE